VIWNYYFLFLYLILDFFSRKDNSATNRTEFILIVGRMYAEYFNGLEKKEAKSWKFVQSTDSIMRNS
jgi:CRISPR/Cas system-associated endonuclease Cas3-HD